MAAGAEEIGGRGGAEGQETAHTHLEMVQTDLDNVECSVCRSKDREESMILCDQVPAPVLSSLCVCVVCVCVGCVCCVRVLCVYTYKHCAIRIR